MNKKLNIEKKFEMRNAKKCESCGKKLVHPDPAYTNCVDTLACLIKKLENVRKFGSSYVKEKDK